MPLKAKRKGTRVEREIVNRFKAAGIEAFRVAGSGAFEGMPGDVRICPKQTNQLIGEVKARKHGEGFTVLERWLAGNDLLFLKRDGQEPMVCLDLDLLISLMGE